MKRLHATLALVFLAAGATAPAAPKRPPATPVPIAETLTLPRLDDSLKFLVIGDSGTGGRDQYKLGDVMLKHFAAFKWELTLMLGDNLYGGEGPAEFKDKFERPYKALLDAGVKFYAALGNHDNPNQRYYKLFNMDAKRYYSVKPSKQSVRFFALDSNYMDPAQLEWLDKELGDAKEDWKICFFHHPIYSSGKRHGPDDALRAVLEPVLLKHHVNLVLVGHEHFYERLQPQKGIHHMISGGAGKLRKDGINKTPFTAKGWSSSLHFVLFELKDDKLWFQAIEVGGKTVDSGVIERQKEWPDPSPTPAASPRAATK